MGLFDIFKKIFNRITSKSNTIATPLLQASNPVTLKPVTEDTYIPIELPENELVSFSSEKILDVSSRAAEDKLKHNLNILIKQAKEKGKLDKFMIIREDDFFPHGWQWDVLSNDTNLESTCTSLSLELRKAFALREAGIEKYKENFGIKYSTLTKEQEYDALKKINKKVGNFLLPSKFRSTKHFTVNTPLEITGDYNFVDVERDYIIIDDMFGFLNSGYAYSAAYHDAYLDVSHESLPISEEAIVLIKDENYERIMADPKVAEELNQRKVVRYKGETHVAINMILTEIGALPSTVGLKYAQYDQETKDIIDNSIKALTSENGIFFDKSHAGSSAKSHFSSYYDDKNQDYKNAVRESIEFLIKKFPEHKELLNQYSLHSNVASKVVDTIGIDELLSAINEYNQQAKEQLTQSLEKHKQDRASITPKMHEQFTQMVSLINEFYTEVPYDSNFDNKSELENEIQIFFQGNSSKEQIQAAKSLWKRLKERKIGKQQNNNVQMSSQSVNNHHPNLENNSEEMR